jgi:hypothetical protein
MAPPSPVHNNGPSFHPENPCFRTRCSVVMPQREERRRKGAATTTTDKSAGEGFRLDQRHACRTLTDKLPITSATPLRMTRHAPKCHHGTTRGH